MSGVFAVDYCCISVDVLRSNGGNAALSKHPPDIVSNAYHFSYDVYLAHLISAFVRGDYNI